MPHWGSVPQGIVLFIKGDEVSSEDAEEFCAAPERQLNVERALAKLDYEFAEAVSGAPPRGMSIQKFRILCGRGYIDLVALHQRSLPSLGPGALDAIRHELRQALRQSGVEVNLTWVRRLARAAAKPASSAPVVEAPASVPPSNAPDTEAPTESENAGQALAEGLPVKPQVESAGSTKAPVEEKRRERRAPAFDRAKAAVWKLFGSNVPPRKDLSDGDLKAAVMKQMRADVLQEIHLGDKTSQTDRERETAVHDHLRACGVTWPISLETVRRASGRRKDKSRARK
jgi:hypothetical protein